MAVTFLILILLVGSVSLVVAIADVVRTCRRRGGLELPKGKEPGHVRPE